MKNIAPVQPTQRAIWNVTNLLGILLWACIQFLVQKMQSVSVNNVLELTSTQNQKKVKIGLSSGPL